MRLKFAFIPIIILCVLLIGGITPSYAQELPNLPHAFYGAIEINGQPAPAGTSVEARGPGVITGGGNPIVTTEVGRYGTQNPLGVHLVFQSDTIRNGDIIEFYVNGTKAAQTYPFNSGDVTQLNITVLTIKYTLSTSVNPPGGGIVNLNPVQPAGGYFMDTVVTLTASANAGYVFTGWSGDFTGYTNPSNITMNSNKNITANFTLSTTKFTLNVTANPAAGGTVSLNPAQPADGYLVGTVVTLTASANAGYVFTGWSGDFTGYTNPATITMNSNKNITANFTLSTTKFTLTVIANPAVGGAVNLNPAQPVDGYLVGTVVTLTAVANAGYAFAGWSGDLTGNTNPVTITVNSNKNITAAFTVTTIKYTLTVSANPIAGGTVSLNPTQPAGGYSSGTVVTLTATTNNGYTFSGWSGDLTGNTNPASITMNLNKNITANFTTATTKYTLSISANPTLGGVISTSPTQPAGGYDSGTVVTLTASAYTGYTFSGWSGDLTGYANPATITMNSNKSLTANFTATTTKYTLTVSANPALGGVINISPAQPAGGYDTGTVVTLSTATNSGYTFSSWSGDLTGNTSPATITMNSNKSIIANFILAGGQDNPGLDLAGAPNLPTRYTLNISVNPSSAGTTSFLPVLPPDGYIAGTLVTLTATANTGYAFSGWSGDLTGNANPATLIMNSNKNVMANFTVKNNKLTVTINPAEGGKVDLNPPQPPEGYPAGTSVTLTAFANPGFGFSSWSGALTGSANPATIILDTDKNVTANFTTGKYMITLTVNPPEGGKVVLNPLQPADGFPAGTVVTLTVSPYSGYSFANWGGDLTGNASPATITMNSKKSVTVNFTAITAARYTLTVSINPADGGKVDINPPQPPEGYPAGTSVTLTASPNSDYTFSSYTGDLTGNTSSATIIMNSNKSVNLNFMVLLPMQAVSPLIDSQTLTMIGIGAGVLILGVLVYKLRRRSIYD